MSEQTQAEEVFKPDRTHLLAAAIMLCIVFIGVSTKPLILGWTLLFPVLFIVWVLKAKTVVSERGISAHYLFAKNQQASWDEIQGVGFKGSKAFVERRDGSSFSLPAISFTSLPKLYDASRGRIPDALTEGRRAADEKVRVVRKDGHEVLMSKEEYERYEASKRAQQEEGKR